MAVLAALLPRRPASADSGPAALRMHIQSNNQFSSASSPATPLRLPEGLVELDVLNGENEPEPWVTAEATVAPCAGSAPTVHACGTDRPTASNVNYVAGQTVPNAVVAASRAAGYAGGSYSCFYAHRTTHLVVDAVGYFASTKDYLYDVVEVP